MPETDDARTAEPKAPARADAGPEARPGGKPAPSPATLYEEIRRSPLLRALQREMDAVFDRVRPGLSGMLDADALGLGPLVPAVDVSETEEAVHVAVEAPGVAREDLELTIAGPSLTIRGRKSAGREEEGRDWRLVERRAGSFRRTIPLGFEPDPDAVTARFEDGVLLIDARKPARSASADRRVEIG